MTKIYSKLFVLLIACCTAFSCSEQNIPELPGHEGDDQQGIASIDQTQINANGGGFIIRVTTNGTWQAASNETWCTLNRTSGSGNGSISGYIKANTGAERSATIQISSGKEKTTFTVKQLAGNGSNPENPAEYARRIEIPKLKGGNMYPFITHTTTENGKEVIAYSYEYDCTKLHSRWVAFTFSTATPDKNVGRNEDFRADPKLPKDYQLTKESYSNSGYSRGHLVASSDRQYSTTANKMTFYMSNMSPQIQNGFNGGIWQKLEDKVQSWGKITNSNDTLYVVKGGTIRDDQIEKYIDSNSQRIAVPKHYFMALLWLKNGSYKAIGFWLDHKSYDKNASYANHTVSIDELEEKTGIDFFHNLPDDIENKVEASYNKNDWGL
ncbi:DNA/RNA non-specific endonuclease [uncultured Bacteroides sp.]|uniref:DNA/RNA non-specific endonuclease n=1 Tax=uncultured Bacteroides sp. TaxID=162156 RepID=UPI0025F78816|nr:DNA/RNA non-specific endonuclease [uncultured Bacteroides sp.]